MTSGGVEWVRQRRIPDKTGDLTSVGRLSQPSTPGV